MSEKLLITTSLKKSWNKKKEMVFLGQWCQKFSNFKDLDKSKYEIFDYHWNDRKKLLDDYNYIIDAGLKALSADSKYLPKLMGSFPENSKYTFMGDEHGKITIPKSSNIKFKHGEVIIIQPSHCDPTVNLYDKCYLIEKDKVSKSWAIDARGYG